MRRSRDRTLQSGGSGPSLVVTEVPGLWRLPTEVGLALVRQATQPPQSSQPFALVLSGSTNMTLVADAVQRGVRSRFLGGGTVTLGGVPCRINALSPDGTLLSLTTPPFDAMCPNASASGCANAALTVLPPVGVSLNTSELLDLAHGTANARALEAALVRSVRSVAPAIACPPFCPGAGGTLPFAIRVQDLLAPGGVVTLRGSTGLTLPPPTDLATYRSWVLPASTLRSGAGSSGLGYAEACTASSSSSFEDPENGACTNASDPRSRLCAYGR